MDTLPPTARKRAFENEGTLRQALPRSNVAYQCFNFTAFQAITSGSLAALSDITAQKLVSNAPLNWRRTLAMALFGLVWSGPSNHYWQKFTNQLFKGKKDAASVAQKVSVCACVYAVQTSPFHILMLGCGPAWCCTGAH